MSLQHAVSVERPEIPDADAFPVVLRAAVQSSGLSLDRIQYRLRMRGVSVSVTALSYWQSGRRRPERAESLAAVGHLESILGLAPGALLTLVGPPRPRGRAHRETSRLPLESLRWTERGPVADLIKQIDVDTEAALTKLSQHDRQEIAADRGEKRTLVRQVFRAERDGVDRSICVYEAGQQSRGGPRITVLPPGRLGRMARDETNGIIAAEILFPAPLHRGETAIVQYALRHPGPPYARSDDSYCRNFHMPVREYVVEMRFDPRALPSYCEQFQLDRSEHVTVRRPLDVDTLGNAHAVALDFGPGSFCVRWEWPAGLVAIE